MNAKDSRRADLTPSTGKRTTDRRCCSATPRGIRPLIAHCHLGLGKLYRRTRQREQAQEHLTTATTMYREMNMQFWLKKSEKETGELH